MASYGNYSVATRRKELRNNLLKMQLLCGMKLQTVAELNGVSTQTVRDSAKETGLVLTYGYFLEHVNEEAK